MDVQVKLSLRSGHLWQFRCHEDDPIIYGLVSALPGTEAGAQLPADGLIQVEADTGERLYLARSSLVSVEVRPLSAGDQADGKRIAARAHALPEGVGGPAPFAHIADALAADVHRALLESALAQEGEQVQKHTSEGHRVLELDGVPAAVRAIEAHVAAVRGALGVAELLEAACDMELTAVGNRRPPTLLKDKSNLAFIYFLHAQPKTFTGGGVRVFDVTIRDGVRRAAHAYRDVVVQDNSLFVFPANVASAGLPMLAPSDRFCDRLLVVTGALRPSSQRA